MAFFNRIRIGGTSVGGERWSTHIDMAFLGSGPAGGGVIDYEELLFWAQGIADLDVFTVAGPLRQLMSTSLALTTVRVEAIADGEVVQVAEVDGLDLPGTAIMTKVPQTALVLSLLTGRPGRSYRGRMYWPACGAAINQGTGRLSNPTIAQVAEAYDNLVVEIGIASDQETSLVPVVYSPTLNVVTPVTQVSVGDVLDTQRRRRDTLVETRATRDLFE